MKGLRIGLTNQNNANAASNKAAADDKRTPMGKVAAMRKMPVKVRLFGDYMFDYLSTCKHNLKDNTYQSCPLCKLADQTTRKFFEREEIQRIQLREQSFVNRALLRCNLIYQWSLCQSLHYSRISNIDPCFEIIWSTSFVDTICAYHDLLTTHYLSTDITFDDMFRMLERRNRMYEVGHFAAVFLQSRIRKFLTKCSIRRMLLRRFEMVPPTKRQDMYFYDQVKQRKWNQYPHLIADEAPGTPRTIERRLTYENRFREDRMKRYYDSLTALRSKNNDSSTQRVPETYIQREEKAIGLFKHLIVLRDLVAVHMQRLMSDRLRALSPPTKRGAAASSALPIDDNSIQGSASVPIAVFVTTMSPGLSARSLGVALALASTPSPATILATAASKQNRLNASSKTIDNGKNAVGISSAAMYRALQILELNIWDSLVIKRADDILPMILCKELIGTYEGIMNIVQDEYGIWNASYNPPLIKDFHSASSSALLLSNNNNIHQGKNPLQRVKLEQELNGFVPITVDDGENRPRSSSKDSRDVNDDFLSGEVLPFGLHLQPTAINMEDRPPSNFFRLFFFEQECIAISAVSPWVYYPEVNKNKESVLASIRRFLASPKLRALVRDYYLSANQVNSPGPFQQQQAKRNNRKRGGSDKHQNHHNNIQSLFTPPEKTIFPPSEHVQMMQEPLTIYKLTDGQVSQLSGRYSFLQKSSEFQKKVEQVRKNEMQRANRGGLASSTSRDSPGIPKTISLDLASLSIAEGEHDDVTTNPAQVEEKLANAQEDFVTAANTDNDDIALRGSEAQKLLTYFLRSSTTGGGGGSRQQKSRAKTPEKAQASRFEETPYVQLLYEHSVNVDTAIQPRIRHMPNETFPEAQLLVIDIQVTLPRPVLPTYLQNLGGRRGGVTQSTALNAKSKAATAAAADDDTSSVDSENSMMSMEILQAAEKEEQHRGKESRYTNYMNLNVKDDYPIIVHQVVGMFCCEKDRAPGNFDGGLFEFEYFRAIYREAVASMSRPASSSGAIDSVDYAVRKLGTLGHQNAVGHSVESLGAANTSIGVGGMNVPPPAGSPPGSMNMFRELGRDRNGWIAPSPFSGVSNCKGVLPSGREFNFNILGANPSREYLEKVLPRKVKIWLGLPV